MRQKLLMTIIFVFIIFLNVKTGASEMENQSKYAYKILEISLNGGILLSNKQTVHLAGINSESLNSELIVFLKSIAKGKYCLFVQDKVLSNGFGYVYLVDYDESKLPVGIENKSPYIMAYRNIYLDSWPFPKKIYKGISYNLNIILIKKGNLRVDRNRNFELISEFEKYEAS